MPWKLHWIVQIKRIVLVFRWSVNYNWTLRDHILGCTRHPLSALTVPNLPHGLVGWNSMLQKDTGSKHELTKRKIDKRMQQIYLKFSDKFFIIIIPHCTHTIGFYISFFVSLHIKVYNSSAGRFHFLYMKISHTTTSLNATVLLILI